MSAPCVVCGGKKSSGVHSRFHADGHQYQDASTPGLKPLSRAREAYREASGYQARSQAARRAVCAFWAAGAPHEVPPFGRCEGNADGLHHIMPRARAGGLEAAEQYPTVPACNAHNTWAAQSAGGLAWSRAHTFYDDATGREWPFLLSMKDVAK